MSDNAQPITPSAAAEPQSLLPPASAPIAQPPADGVQPPAAPEGQPNPRSITYNGETLEIPDNYWDAEAGAANIGALVKSNVDLRKKLSEERPEPPESYEIVVPEDFANQGVSIAADDPLAVSAQEWAKKNGLTQDVLNEGIALYLKGRLAGLPSRETELQKVGQAFGDGADKTMADLANWSRGVAGDDPAMMQALDAVSSTADGIILLHHLKTKLAAPSPMIPGAKVPTSPALDEEALRALQASDAYISGDPATRKKVIEGWERLYPGNVA
jgi:hypothetical protein